MSVTIKSQLLRLFPIGQLQIKPNNSRNWTKRRKIKRSWVQLYSVRVNRDTYFRRRTFPKLTLNLRIRVKMSTRKTSRRTLALWARARSHLYQSWLKTSLALSTPTNQWKDQPPCSRPSISSPSSIVLVLDRTAWARPKACGMALYPSISSSLGPDYSPTRIWQTGLDWLSTALSCCRRRKSQRWSTSRRWRSETWPVMAILVSRTLLNACQGTTWIHIRSKAGREASAITSALITTSKETIRCTRHASSARTSS